MENNEVNKKALLSITFIEKAKKNKGCSLLRMSIINNYLYLHIEIFFSM